MRRAALAAVVSALVLLAAAWGQARAVAFSEGPPPAHTGGFGEPTCRACHFDGPLNPPDGSLELVGLPAAYTPGRDYLLHVRLEHPGLRRAGFQLAARFTGAARRGATETGDAGKAAAEVPPVAAGAPAGRLHAVDASVVVVEIELAGPGGSPIQASYAQQTLEGSNPAAPGAAAWRVRWTAPEAGAVPVVFHIAANAANGDASELGDFILAGEWTLRPNNGRR